MHGLENFDDFKEGVVVNNSRASKKPMPSSSYMAPQPGRAAVG